MGIYDHAVDRVARAALRIADSLEKIADRKPAPHVIVLALPIAQLPDDIEKTQEVIKGLREAIATALEE